MEQFLAHILIGKRPGTIAPYRRLARCFGNFLKWKPVSELTTDDIAAYTKAYYKVSHARIPRRFVRWLEDMNYIPTGKIKLRLVPRPPPAVPDVRPVAFDQYRTLLWASKQSKYQPWLYSAILIAWNTGLRMSDIAHLKWESVDFANGMLSINVVKKMRVSQRIEIPINTELRTHLLELWNTRVVGHRYVLLYMYGRYITHGGRCKIILYFRRLLNAVGMPNHSFHSLRHGFVTKMINNGADPITIGSITGQSVTTVARYCHPTLDAKRRAMDSADQAAAKEATRVVELQIEQPNKIMKV